MGDGSNTRELSSDLAAAHLSRGSCLSQLPEDLSRTVYHSLCRRAWMPPIRYRNTTIVVTQQDIGYTSSWLVCRVQSSVDRLFTRSCADVRRHCLRIMCMVYLLVKKTR
ncbi:hypothetical protein IG631_09086 [Alternaria alternata]|nr:hypothetical protein IG631_09086 [Alternaria alternata]